MKVSNYQDSEPVEEVDGVFKREVISAGDGAPNFCMRIFEVKSGSATPSHSHPFEHEIFILAGQGVIVSSQGATSVSKENVVFIAPEEAHCFVNTGSEPLRFICVIPLQQE